MAWPAGKATALFVKDGGEWEKITLDPNAVATGQIFYRPHSSEVLVRLNETGGVSEMVDVLGLPPAVEVAQTAPAAPSVEQTADRALPSPVVAEKPAPAPPPGALRTIDGTIRVDVLVSIAANGTVHSAQMLKPSHSSYFDRLSLAAAQTSRFQPATSSRSLVLHYEYTHKGVSVSQREP
jgi:TonB family protein